MKLNKRHRNRNKRENTWEKLKEKSRREDKVGKRIIVDMNCCLSNSRANETEA